jgi:PIN domain nuclease of toxin-antitoxin system
MPHRDQRCGWEKKGSSSFLRKRTKKLLIIEPAHLLALEGLPSHHRDPFDHLLVAQALAEDATLMTDDRRLSAYPVQVVSCSNVGG